MPQLTPEYVRETKAPQILGTFWAFFTVSLLMVSARLYIRAKTLRNIGSDDYIIAASIVLLAGYTAVTTVNVHLGYGTHAAVIEQKGGEALLEHILLINYIDFTLGIMSFTTPKLAIAALLNRILNPSKWQRVLLWFLTGLVFVASTICIIVLFTMCSPPKSLWLISMQVNEGATCRPISLLVDYAIFTGAVSAFVDLFLAFYPTIVLIKLQMSLKKKLALCAALGLGTVACAMAVVKCFQLPGLADEQDPTYGTAELVIWTAIESNIIIIASCIPTLGPFYEMIRGKRSWSSHGRYYKSSNQLRSSSADHGVRKPNYVVRKPHDDLMITKIGETKDGSQESILRSEEFQNGGHPLGEIRRTDNVTVEYERSQGLQKPPASWYP